jgi:Na+-transporting methylmalonyl-CoA/oxaloacetate decarboxylase, beta subunit
MRRKKSNTIGIIGGADGPTSIIVGDVEELVIIAAAAVVGLAIFLAVCRNLFRRR